MPALNALNLFVDYAAKQLVTSQTNATVIQLPALFNTNLQNFNVTLLTQTGNPVAPFTVFNSTGYTLDIVIGPAPSGSSPPALLAFIDGLSSAANVFSGAMTINTDAIDTFIGTAAQNMAYFEMTLIDGSGNRLTIYQGTIILKAALDNSAGTVPTPAASYLTALQCNAAFVRQVGLPGQTLTLVSPGNLYQRILGVDDSGNPIDAITHV